MVVIFRASRSRPELAEDSAVAGLRRCLANGKVPPDGRTVRRK